MSIKKFLFILATASTIGACQTSESAVKGDGVSNSPHAPATEGAPFLGEFQGALFQVLITADHKQALLKIGKHSGRSFVLLNLVEPLACAGCFGGFGDDATATDSKTLIRLVQVDDDRAANPLRIDPSLLTDDASQPTDSQPSEDTSEALPVTGDVAASLHTLLIELGARHSQTTQGKFSRVDSISCVQTDDIRCSAIVDGEQGQEIGDDEERSKSTLLLKVGAIVRQNTKGKFFDLGAVICRRMDGNDSCTVVRPQ